MRSPARPAIGEFGLKRSKLLQKQSDEDVLIGVARAGGSMGAGLQSRAVAQPKLVNLMDSD